MGEFLSQPNKEKHSDDGENSFVSDKKIIYFIVTFWSMWNARMAKENGGRTYYRYISR